RFLDDNREDLLIPASRDFFVVDLYDARKRGRQNVPLPRQIVLEYAWREEIPLEGARFGPYAGRLTTMLCGGTLVFNDDGNALSWRINPGPLPTGGNRRNGLLYNVAAQVAAGRVGAFVGSPRGLLGSMLPPVTVEEDGEMVRFQLSPHLHLSEEKDLEQTGERQWQISC